MKRIRINLTRIWERSIEDLGLEVSQIQQSFSKSLKENRTVTFDVMTKVIFVEPHSELTTVEFESTWYSVSLSIIL